MRPAEQSRWEGIGAARWLFLFSKQNGAGKTGAGSRYGFRASSSESGAQGGADRQRIDVTDAAERDVGGQALGRHRPHIAQVFRPDRQIVSVVRSLDAQAGADDRIRALLEGVKGVAGDREEGRALEGL